MVFGSQPDFFLITFSLIYLIITAILSLILIWSRNVRNNPAILPFQILLVLFIIATVILSLFSFTNSLDTWILLEKIGYFSYAYASVFFFIVTWQYIGYKDIWRCKLTPLMFIVPSITILLLWMPGYQSLMMSDFYFDTSGIVPTLVYQYGIWGYVHTINNVIFMFGSLVLLVISFYSHTDTRKKGIQYLLAGFIIFCIWNMLYTAGFIPLWVFNLPFPLLLFSILMSIAIFRYNALDFLPMARNLVLEQISDLFLIISVDNRVIDINPSMAQAFDLNHRSSIGAHISEVFSNYPDFISILSESDGNVSFFSLKKGELALIYAIKKSTISDKEGNVLGNVLILHDITELEHALDMLEKSNTELQLINTKLQDEITERKKVEGALHLTMKKLTLLNSMTRHDIRNQLRTILGFLYFDKKELTDPEQIRRNQMENNACLSILNHIEFAQLYQDVGKYEPIWNSVSEILDKVIGQLNLSEIKIIHDISDFELFADPMFEKVLYTCFDNSIKHGERVTEIKIWVDTHSDSCSLMYCDNGVGIQEDEKEVIFNHGYGKNTGIGLFLAKEILAITKLTIKETGEPGKGSRFEIEIPTGFWRINFSTQHNIS